MGMTQQLDLFDLDETTNKFPTDKPVRLITLFSGYDAQALALKYANIPFEHYKTCEWAVNSISALKDIHFANDNTDYSKDLTKEEIVQYLLNKGISNNYSTSLTEEEIRRYSEEKLRDIYNDIHAEHNLVDIKQVHGKDLEIVDTDKYSYCVTYSYPCQSVSLAGKRHGMAKGSGTRSSMLWEVERILNECENKPQVLLMENVDAVLSQAYKKDFLEWVHTLDLLGYHSYYQVLNAKDYGLPQSRKRLFMVSLLGDYYYAFPNPYPLKYRLKDLLEDEVDDKYYVSDRALHGALTTRFESSKLENRLPDKDDVARTLRARDWKDPKLVEVSGNKSQAERVYDPNGLSSCLCAGGGGLGGKTGLYKVPQKEKFTIIGDNGEIKEIERNIDESGLVEFGEYLTWSDNQGNININTQCNRASKEDGVALTLDTLNGHSKVVIKEETPKSVSIKGEEADLKRVGQYYSYPNNQGNTQGFRAYPEDGVMGTIRTLDGDAKVLEKQEPLKKELCNYLIEENKVQEGDVISHSYTKNRINKYTSDESHIENNTNHDCSPALTTRADTLGVVIKDKRLNETIDENELELEEGAYAIDTYNKTTHDEYMQTIKANVNNNTAFVQNNYSIRKLTPRECFRLMGVKDEDFDKIKGLSNAALYHLAGDSICTTVLIAIFNKLFKGENTKYGN